MRGICASVIIALMLTATSASAITTTDPEAVSTFNSDDEGWTGSGDATAYSYVSTGGNPGGCLEYDDNANTGSEDGTLLAPDKFKGDWSILEGTGYLSFDHKIRVTGGVNSYYYPTVRIETASGRGWATWTGKTKFVSGKWETIRIPIRQEEWVVIGTWSSILKDTDKKVKILIEGVGNTSAGRDIDQIDNVILALDCDDNGVRDSLEISSGVQQDTNGNGTPDNCEPDLDSDGDGTKNGEDTCLYDDKKIEPGFCGCGNAETDSDSDRAPDCIDECPRNPAKMAQGQCGCEEADTDTDGDGVADCKDGCPTNFAKDAAGQCGCAASDQDTDSDGTADCHDACPTDPRKTEAGDCGCGVPDIDTDGDGVFNCQDGCPSDPLKIAPGVCGCQQKETDSDNDGVPDCRDLCPSQPSKSSPGVCGCDTLETDTDKDGLPDCADQCPNDPRKITPGVCGCGVSDADSDGDGMRDCFDQCPNDKSKIAPGACGCGVPENQCAAGSTTERSSSGTDSGRTLPETLAPNCGTGAGAAVVSMWLLVMAVPTIRRSRKGR